MTRVTHTPPRSPQVGVWAAEEFTAPWEWRKANRAAAAGGGGAGVEAQAAARAEQRSAKAAAATAGSGRGGCAIKGNIQGKGGDLVYHVPGAAAYERTVIDESKGERYFCSEAEAQAAGWRAAKS